MHTQTEAVMAENKAHDDELSAELAQQLLQPLQNLADAADMKAHEAEVTAVQLRRKADQHITNDERAAITYNEALTAKERAIAIQKVESRILEDEDAAMRAENDAMRARAEAEACFARAKEAVEVHVALVEIAVESRKIALSKRKMAEVWQT
jgi:hypothetical protein